MFGFTTEDRPLALASALTYWAFRCRDKQKSPANGLKTWEYLQSSIENAAIPARDLNDYLVYLSKKLIVPTLKPAEWRRLVKPDQIVIRATPEADKSLGDIVQLDQDQALAWESWEEIINRWSIQYGITQRHVLRQCLSRAQIVSLHCRLKHEEDKLIWQQPEEETIDV